MPDLPLPPVRRPAQITPAETPGLTGLLTLAVAVVVVAGLYLGRSVLIPITLAVLLSFLLAPVVNGLRHVYVPRVMAVLLAVVLSLAVMLAVGTLIATQVADLAQEVPLYASTIQQKMETVQSFTLGRMSTIMRGLGRNLDRAATPAPARPAAQEATPAEPKPIPVEVHQPDPTALQIAERIISPVVDPLSTTAIVFIVSIFIQLQREDLRDRLIRLFGSSDLHRTTAAMNDAARRLSRYFLTQLAINAAFGVITGTGLFFIGIPSALLWGILGMMLRFVPYIGPPLAAIFPLALAAAVEPGWSKMLWTGGLYLVTELIMGQAVEPLMYGRSTGLSPFSVVVAATVWTWLWGPIGLILSTPLTLCLVVLGRHVERLEFLDVLLGDRPALTPVESFYQRMLAGDADETLEQAELLLKERSLSSYYDEVALKGLQLAAVDVARGVLGEAHIERIKDASRGLVDDLDSYEDHDPHPEEAESSVTAASRAEQDLPKQPAPAVHATDHPDLAPEWRVEAPVLCVAGRGPLDEAAAAMLAQLLRKHGLGARVMPYGAVSRGSLASLDLSGTAMVCLSYLELGGGISHLRYLLRRLKARAPGIPVLVGLWPTEAEILRDDRLRSAVGADYYASSLHDAVEACVEAATTRTPANADNGQASAAAPAA
jgi:predicted PurR-regulated permease PerM